MFFKFTAYLLAPFYLVALLWRGRHESGYWRGFSERFGRGESLPAPVWLHAASVGEVHDLVNSSLSDAIGRRDVAEAENVQLRQDAKDAEAGH